MHRDAIGLVTAKVDEVVVPVQILGHGPDVARRQVTVLELNDHWPGLREVQRLKYLPIVTFRVDLQYLEVPQAVLCDQIISSRAVGTNILSRSPASFPSCVDANMWVERKPPYSCRAAIHVPHAVVFRTVHRHLPRTCRDRDVLEEQPTCQRRIVRLQRGIDLRLRLDENTPPS